MGNDICVWDGKWGEAEINFSQIVMRSQTFLVTCVIIEVLKIYIILLNEVVMLVDREGRVARGKGGGKTIFPCLDGSFGFIVTVSVWGEIIGI